MNYVRVDWKHEIFSELICIYSEVDDGAWEVRKVEVFSRGAMGYASKSKSAAGTGLSKEPLPSLNKIATDPQFEPMTIYSDEFERVWQSATK